MPNVALRRELGHDRPGAVTTVPPLVDPGPVVDRGHEGAAVDGFQAVAVVVADAREARAGDLPGDEGVRLVRGDRDRHVVLAHRADRRGTRGPCGSRRCRPPPAPASPVAPCSMPVASIATCPDGLRTTSKIVAGSAGMVRCTSKRSLIAAILAGPAIGVAPGTGSAGPMPYPRPAWPSSTARRSRRRRPS